MIHASVNISILVSLGLLLLVNVAFNPLFLSALFALILWCRYWNFKQGKLLAKKWTYLLLSAALASIYISYSTFIGVDAGVAVLATFLFAKSLETKSQRDALILFNFALFVTASSFLYSQSMWMTLGVIAVLLSCLTGLYRLHSSHFPTANVEHSLKQDSWQIIRVLLYATPFFVLLFLFFPRLPPLWHIPLPDQKGITGMSDRMSPGDLAELSQSSELAFRIIGDMQQLPKRSELYWRAMVLDQYDGSEWTAHAFNQRETQLTPQAPHFQYQYLAADPRIAWIMGLEQSIPQEARYFLRHDGGIMAYRQQMRMQPIQLAWVGTNHSQTLPTRFKEKFLQHNIQYTPSLDPQAQQLAQQLLLQAKRQPERYIELVLAWYKQQNFVYSLKPGLLGQHRVDEFLFQSKTGFCEHYASSFAMLLRYAGIPVRIVLGYQGGQLAPDGKSWEVRQLDAHAWTEVYLGERWQRFDPTAIIAPSRIDDGMQQYLEQDQQLWGENQQLWNYQQFKALKNIRVWSDYLSYQWQSKIIGYDAKTQYEWLSKLGLHSSYSLILILILSVISILATYFVWIYAQARAVISPYDRALQRFSKSLKFELHKQTAETTSQWMQRLAEFVPEEQRIYFKNLAQMDQLQRYADLDKAVDFKQFKKMLKKCAIALKNK